MCAPWIPRLLAAAAPDARLMVLLRDPLDRYVSGLQHDASTAAAWGEPLSSHAPLAAFARGRYHAQMTNLLAHFDRSQVLVLQYERCTSEPLTELRRTFEFLGLRDTKFAPDHTAKPKYQASKPTLDALTREAYVQAYSDDVLALARDFPEIELSRWPNFAHLAS